MGFLKKFFKNVFHAGAVNTQINSSFERLNEEELETHLAVDRYGSFRLTDAIRPSYDLKVVPTQGFRHDFYYDEESKAKVPVLMAAASSERLMDVFMDLLDSLGNEVDVVLETSHARETGGHTDLYREHIDMPVLKSTLWDYEDMILNDGCTGIAVLNPAIPLEIQFDEHKLLIVYGQNLKPFESIFRSHNVRCNDQMRFLTEAEHVHSSNEKFNDQFEELRMRLGLEHGHHAEYAD
jgi:hypothetical protein